MTQYKLRLEILETLSELVSPTLPSLPSPPASPPKPLELPLPREQPKRKLKEEEDIKPTARPQGLGLSVGGKNVGEREDVKRARIDPPSRPPPKSHIPSPLLNRADSKPPTPDLPSSAAHVKVLEVPSQPSPLAQPFKAGDEWRAAFPKERLRKLASSYRAAGRELKHSGDATARSATSIRDSHLAIVQQAEAILLYVFAFWCDDQAARACIVQNWQSIFGLLVFVKRAAEKANLGIVVGVCLRMEAYIAFTLSNHEQKALSFRGNQLLQSSSQPSTSLHPSPLAQSHSPTSVPSPADPTDPPTLAASTELVKAFTKASADLFRTQKLWEESGTYLAPTVLAAVTPGTWGSILSNVLGVEGGEMVVPTKPWRFQGWGMELRKAMAVPQGVGFARAVLEEWAGREGLGFVGREVREE